MHIYRHKAFLITSIILFTCLINPTSLPASNIIQKKISIDVSNKPIAEILSIIERIADVRFMYNANLLHNKKPVSISVRNVPIVQILKTIINDNALVFYQMDKYIIIAKKGDAIPKGIKYEKAVIETRLPDQSTQVRHIVDTIHVIDPVKIISTSHEKVFDTIKVFDTVRVAQVVPQTKTDAGVKQKKLRDISLAFEAVPSFGILTNNPKDKGQPSLDGSFLVQKKTGAIVVSMGVGVYLQRGTSATSVETTKRDSTLHESSKTEVHRYKVGDYYYREGSQIIHETLYDSVVVTIPYSWYSYNNTITRNEEKSTYSITWLQVPVRFSYFSNSKKALKAGISVTLRPSIPIATSGDMYYDATGISRPLSKTDLKAFTIFTSFAPVLLYNISSSIALDCGLPILTSPIQFVKGEKYRILSVGLQLGMVLKL